MLVFDAHLDLSMNAVERNRDLTRPLDEIRSSEAGLSDFPDRGRGVVCFPEMRRGGVGLCAATLIARVEHSAYSPVFGWRSQAQAWAMTRAQQAWYDVMEEAGEIAIIRNVAALDAIVEQWLRPARAAARDIRPIGCLLTLEGADAILTPAHLERMVASGLRAVGPAHYGPGVYANGTGADGPLGGRGRELLRQMDALGLILDATHLNDACFWEALDLFSGPVWGSHQNCRALTPNTRQWSDEQIRAVIARGGVLGAAFDAWMLVPGWERGRSRPESMGATLDKVADNIDRVCQLAGDAFHAGIGSDLDGGFGSEQTPVGVDSIAVAPSVLDRLSARGYSEADLLRIAHGNFVEFLRRSLPGGKGWS
jgi:membrane dipeptidase